MLYFRAFRHVLNGKTLEAREIIGIVRDESMTRQVSIGLTHVLFVPLIASRFLLGFMAVPRCLLSAIGPPLPCVLLSAGLVDAFSSHGFDIKGLPVGRHQGLGDPAISGAVPKGSSFAWKITAKTHWGSTPLDPFPSLPGKGNARAFCSIVQC
jgi:hypothetical protein